jgi:membrane protein
MSLDTAAPQASNSAHPGRLQEAWAILKETISEWSEDNAARLAAALSCYTLLSIAPLVVLSVFVAGLAFGEEAARGQIAGEIGSVVGHEAAQAIQTIVANAESPGSGIIGSIVGIAVLLFGASGVFGELQAALNTIWEVAPKPGRGIMGVIRDRFFSFSMVLGVAFLLLVSLVLSAGLAAVGAFFSHRLPGGEVVWQIVNFVVSFAMTTGLFAVLFKMVPDVQVKWKYIWVGAAVTALLFTIGKFGLGLYIGRASTTSAYGAAGSLVALVLWVFYSSQVLFLGAEFTQVYAQHFGGRIRPASNAIPLQRAVATPGEGATSARHESASTASHAAARPSATDGR